jgi:dCTP deaminase
MGILVKHEIEEAIKKGLITGYGKPIDPENVGVNSVDVTLGSTLKTYFPNKVKTLPDGSKILVTDQTNLDFIDMKKENKVYEREIPEEGIILLPNTLYLGYTNEAIGSKWYIPMYEGRSSMARLGIQSHISAGFGDIGFDAQWTLEINVSHPIKIYKDIRIGQVFFMKIEEEVAEVANKLGNLYQGKYGMQKGVQESKSHMDFK